MPRHQSMPLPAGVWTQLTANDVTGLTVSNEGRWSITLAGTAGAAPPDEDAPILRLGPEETLLSDVTLAILWPGIAATRVWALSIGGGPVSVSHA